MRKGSGDWYEDDTLYNDFGDGGQCCPECGSFDLSLNVDFWEGESKEITGTLDHCNACKSIFNIRRNASK